MLGEDIKKLRDRMVELSENKKSVKTVKKPKGSKGAVDQDGDGKAGEFDDVQVARMTAGGVPKKKAIAKATSDKMEEGWDDMVKSVKDRAHDTTGMKTGEKKKSSTGGTIEKTSTGVKHTAGKNYGGADAPKTPDSDKKAKKESVASEGKDEGKPGKNFAKIAKAAGGGEKGNKIAGKVRADLAAKGKLEESNAVFKHNVKFVNESLAFLINEDEEGKAKAITAASDIVNDFTSWMQRVGQYQTKAIIELADAIKADFGAAEAEAFKQAVAPALAATLETLTSQRETISSAVAVLAGEAAPEEPMGMEPGADAGMPPEAGMDMSAPDEMNPEPAGDEFAGADAAAGDGTTGRAVRESKFARKLAESHSIMSKLAR